MFGNRSYKGSSAFLKTAKKAEPPAAMAESVAAPEHPPIDEGAVLALVSQMAEPTPDALAKRLDVGRDEIDPVIEKLVADGFCEAKDDCETPLTLSASGERAVRYTRMAKF